MLLLTGITPYFNKPNAVSQAGFWVAKLLDNASGFRPFDRLFSIPPAPAIVLMVLAVAIRLFTSNPLLNMLGLIPPASVATLDAMLAASATLPAFASHPLFWPANELSKEVAFMAVPNCVSNLPALELVAVVALLFAFVMASGICACAAANSESIRDKLMIFFIPIDFSL